MALIIIYTYYVYEKWDSAKDISSIIVSIRGPAAEVIHWLQK